MAARRLLVFGTAILMTAFAAREMHKVLGVNGVTPLEIAILIVFVTLFAWIALALASSLAGFASLLAGGGHRPDAHTGPIPRTALLMPAYNEQPARIMATLAVIHADLARLGEAATFDLFILSDTTDPDAWIAEEAAYLALLAQTGAQTGAQNIFYRRRARNTDRKAGNIADWVRRWGAAYPQFMILDADSVMTGECILTLACTMAAMPGAGLIQSLPVIVGGQTLFARMQQFAGRVYGPMIAHGIAWWHGADGNYWGHNAMIRTQAFADAAGLPVLPGRKPFGGTILSHDFVEAALIRRAGWAVHMLPGLPGSYEESPPSLTDLAIRDRRWCQGNLQHMAVLPSRGLHWISRMHLLMGIGSYVTAPLWLLFLVMGIMISIQSQLVLPNYFPAGPSLFPVWPAVDPVRSMWVFIGTMAVLLGPKLLAWFALLLRSADRRGCGGAIRSLLSVLVETLLAGLLAPVAMLFQSAAVVTILMGRDGGWAPQRRDDGRVPFSQTLRAYWPHTLTGLLLGLVSWFISVPLLLWMSPVVIGLALAAPLADLTARRGAGRALRRIGLLQTPEEAAPPAVLQHLARLQPDLVQPEMPAFTRLLSDPALLAAHRAMLPPPRRRHDPLDVALLTGMARLAEMDDLSETAALSRAERAAILANAEALQRVESLAAG
jgi:membrane glycosyltransferase